MADRTGQRAKALSHNQYFCRHKDSGCGWSRISFSGISARSKHETNAFHDCVAGCSRCAKVQALKQRQREAEEVETLRQQAKEIEREHLVAVLETVKTGLLNQDLSTCNICGKSLPEAMNDWLTTDKDVLHEFQSVPLLRYPPMKTGQRS